MLQIKPVDSDGREQIKSLHPRYRESNPAGTMLFMCIVPGLKDGKIDQGKVEMDDHPNQCWYEYWRNCKHRYEQDDEDLPPWEGARGKRFGHLDDS